MIEKWLKNVEKWLEKWSKSDFNQVRWLPVILHNDYNKIIKSDDYNQKEKKENKSVGLSWIFHVHSLWMIAIKWFKFNSSN